jgi:hypothetical protein
LSQKVLISFSVALAKASVYDFIRTGFILSPVVSDAAPSPPVPPLPSKERGSKIQGKILADMILREIFALGCKE